MEEVSWVVETYDSDTGLCDSENGAIEVDIVDLADEARLRALIIEDFESRGEAFEDWAYGDITSVRVEINGTWYDL